MRNDVADNDGKPAAETAHCLALCRRRTEPAKCTCQITLPLHEFLSLMRMQVKVIYAAYICRPFPGHHQPSDLGYPPPPPRNISSGFCFVMCYMCLLLVFLSLVYIFSFNFFPLSLSLHVVYYTHCMIVASLFPCVVRTKSHWYCYSIHCTYMYMEKHVYSTLAKRY